MALVVPMVGVVSVSLTTAAAAIVFAVAVLAMMILAARSSSNNIHCTVIIDGKTTLCDSCYV